MPYYPNKPGPQLLVDMLNDLLGTNYTTDYFTIGLPREVTRDDGRNTAVDMTVAAGPLTGHVSTMYYKRLDLAMLLTPRQISLPIDGTVADSQDLAAPLNALLGWDLQRDDLLATPVESGLTVSHEVAASPDSLVCIGSGTLELTREPFATVRYNATLPAEFVDPDWGTLAGVPNRNFAILEATDLLLSIRLVPEDANSDFYNIASDLDHNYPLDVLDDRSWYLTMALGGAQAPILAAAGRLRLSITHGAETQLFPITWDAVTPRYKCNLGGWDSVAMVEPDGQTAMFRLAVTDALFGPNFADAALNSNSTCLGTFGFSMQVLDETLALLGELPVSVTATTI